MIENILIIIEQSLLYIPIILGAYCSMSLMKVPNLAIESSFVLGAIFGYKFVNFQLAAIFAAAIGGLIVSIINTIISQNLRLSYLLSAIVTIGLFTGINQYILGSSHASIGINNLTVFKSFEQFPVVTTLFIIVGFITFLFFIFLKTELGISCAIYGNNSKFFERYNISSYLIFITGMSISGALAGVSGYFVSQVNGFVDISMSLGISLLCITILMIGKALIKLNKPVTILVPLIGTVAYFSLQQILLKIGFDLRYFNVIQSAVILVIIMLMQQNKDAQNELGL